MTPKGTPNDRQSWTNSNLLLSDLNVPPYFGLLPIRSIISGMHEANTAYSVTYDGCNDRDDAGSHSKGGGRRMTGTSSNCCGMVLMVVD